MKAKFLYPKEISEFFLLKSSADLMKSIHIGEGNMFYSKSESEQESHSVMSDSLQPHGLSMEFYRPDYWSRKPFSFPGDLSNPGIEPRSPILWTDSLPAEPQGKPKNTGVGSLFFLQQIFLTQESNWSLKVY